MIDYSGIYEILSASPFQPWVAQLKIKIENVFNSGRWGLQREWQNVYDALPDVNPVYVDLNSSCVTLTSPENVQISSLLMKLHPWRKGPFNIFGTFIDTEWRSDVKWDRLKDRLDPLNGRKILDVGCGSGYHCLRAKGAGAEIVIGIEPMLKYIYQFYTVQKYIKQPSCAVFPLGIDDMPDDMPFFDTVFSMGVIYHRRSAHEHIQKLRSLLRNGGQLVLESLVIDGRQGDILVPEERYGKMRNVWHIPSVLTMQSWMVGAGFNDVECIDVSVTTTDEQRKTGWMTFESLADFLDPQDNTRTIEGYPAPRRAIVTGRK